MDGRHHAALALIPPFRVTDFGQPDRLAVRGVQEVEEGAGVYLLLYSTYQWAQMKSTLGLPPSNEANHGSPVGSPDGHQADAPPRRQPVAASCGHTRASARCWDGHVRHWPCIGGEVRLRCSPVTVSAAWIDWLNALTGAVEPPTGVLPARRAGTHIVGARSSASPSADRGSPSAPAHVDGVGVGVVAPVVARTTTP